MVPLLLLCRTVENIYKPLNDIKMNKEFVRVRSVKDIVVFTSLIVIGSILIALPSGAGVNITGFFMIFAGLILALVLRTGFKDISNGERYCRKEHYFLQEMKAEVLSALIDDPALIDMSKEDAGNGLKVDVYYSKVLDKAYVQVFEYIPYNYLPCSPIYEYEIGRVSNLIR